MIKYILSKRNFKGCIMTRTAKLSFYFILFIIFGLIGLWMPLLGDDLHWGTYFGSNYFPHGIFTYYDGRYLGDLLVISMTKIKPVAFMAYGIFPTTIVYLIQKIREQITPEKNIGLVSSALAAALILLSPVMIFKQILGWHAGFANYLPSAIFPLFLLYLVLKNYDNKNVHYYRTSMILIFLASVATQFFAEHITLLNCFNVVLVWIFFRKHFGEQFKKVLNLILAGNILGAILMFINGAYIKILLGSDAYRSVSNGSKDTLFNYLKITYTPKHLIVVGTLVLAFTIFMILYSLKINNTKQKIANFALLLSTYVAIAPFIVVSPFGSRCMFASYVFLVTIFTINLDIFFNNYEKILLPVFALLTLCLGVRMDYLSHDYGKTFDMQIQYSQYQNTITRDDQYFLQYRSDKYIWLTAPIQNDNNFSELYVKNKDRNMIPINYWDWTDAMRKLKGKKFKTHDDYMRAFDKQILKKVKLIQAKDNK